MRNVISCMLNILYISEQNIFAPNNVFITMVSYIYFYSIPVICSKPHCCYRIRLFSSINGISFIIINFQAFANFSPTFCHLRVCTQDSSGIKFISSSPNRSWVLAINNFVRYTFVVDNIVLDYQ